MNKRAELYRKQINLEEVGEDGQKRLDRASVLVIGAGGLGCPALQYLAGAGVGKITIVDHDKIETSNLHRQPLFSFEDAGRFKAEIASQKLSRLNPYINISWTSEKFSPENAEMVKDYDLALDCSDNFFTKFLIHDICHLYKIPLVTASVYKFEFQMSVFSFSAEAAPCLRCLYPEEPVPAAGNCAEAGVLGPLPGTAGAMQAAEALKFLLGMETPPQGSSLLFSLRTLEGQKLNWKKNVTCPLCGPEGWRRLAELPQFDAKNFEVAEGQLAGKTLVDVREKDELRSLPSLPNAIHIPLSRGESKHYEFAKSLEGEIVFYCHKGSRSLGLARHLRSRGLSKCYSLSGGLAGAQS